MVNCGDLAAGAALQEVITLVKRAWKFRSTRRKLRSDLEGANASAEKMRELNRRLGRPKAEGAVNRLLESAQNAETVLNRNSNVPWWQCCSLPWKQAKLEEALGDYVRANALLNSMIALHITELAIGSQVKLQAPKPDHVFGVGLDNPSSPFNLLKNQLLVEGTSPSVLVLSAPSGIGKTTLAKLLCWDQDVIGKFRENILFINVSQTPNFKAIVRSLFQHYGWPVPNVDLSDDKSTISHLTNLSGEIRSPTMLVLDDVCNDLLSNSLIEAFNGMQLPDFKILVTSKFSISGFGFECGMEPLIRDDKIALLSHFALPNDGRLPHSNDYQEKIDLIPQIAESSYGLPLLLEMIGGFLKRKDVIVWRKMKKNLFESLSRHPELHTLFKKFMDQVLEGKTIKECLMDLALFPEDQKIPVAALVDIWTERQKKPDDCYAVSIVYDLIDRHLANLVVRREGASDLHEYYNHHFLMQHGLYREMIIFEANEKPYKRRTRFMFDDRKENNSSQERQQKTIVAHTLSISTGKMLTPELSNIVKAKAGEVLVLNLRTKKYTIPDFIGEMNKLKVLIVTNYDHFYYSELSNFELLHSLSSLKRIRFERVSVTTFGKWHNLQKLSLYNCSTKEAFESDSIPISEALPNLVELCIDYCIDLVKLPAGFCDITSIQKLSITRCMGFIELPTDIGKLNKLKILRLSSCAVFEEIPTSIGNLIELRFLDISGCVSLHDLPEEVGDLINLERLHMTDCSCKTPPSTVTNLGNLKTLVCDEETAINWKEDVKPSLPNLRIEEANDHTLFLFYDM